MLDAPTSLQSSSCGFVADSSDICDRSIGDILRQAQALTAEQVQSVLVYQREHGVRFGEAAMAMGYLSGREVTWALAQQFHYPYVANEGNVSPELVVARDPFSDEAEVFRSLRSQLMVHLGDSNGAGKVIALLSSQSGEGKTFFSANLGVAFSQLGGRTLLIDANMRSPRLHNVFEGEQGGQPNAGLSSILAGRSTVQVISPVVGLPGLFILPVGTVPPNPLELLERPSFGLLTKELRTKFDHIVIDTPAAAAGNDSVVVSASCDCALMVVRSGVTSVSATRKLIKRVQMGKTAFAGAVLNRF